jgi:hypothetical protein
MIARLLGISLILSVAALSLARALPRADKALAHMVFFTLKERTPENLAKMLEISHKYLSKHEGSTYFSVGVRAEDADEPVSVKDFDVALHVVFASKEAKDRYLVHPRHLQFVEAGKDLWSKVRVFDSYLDQP